MEKNELIKNREWKMKDSIVEDKTIKPKMEQRVIYNIYDEPKASYVVTGYDGKEEFYLNYDSAYRRFITLLERAGN